ncbi:MAG: hypothetical protein EAZ30_06585 [Betaproteobacteria bacterium]|nr:MAG: hypothetical protein EAZ30_06585 [Betaproteobacteria bacterium]
MNAARRPAFQTLPLWRDANRCLLLVQRAVSDFPRCHKYAVGAELRRLAMEICRLVARAAQCSSTLQNYASAKLTKATAPAVATALVVGWAPRAHQTPANQHIAAATRPTSHVRSLAPTPASTASPERTLLRQSVALRPCIYAALRPLEPLPGNGFRPC